MGGIKPALVLLLTVSVLSLTAFSYWPFPSARGSVLDPSIVTFYGTALLITVFIIALSYMLGTGFGLKGAVAFAKEELVYLVFTLSIFIILAGVDSLLSALMNGFTKYNDVFVPVNTYLVSYQAKLFKMYIHFEVIEFTIGLLSGINFGMSYLSFTNIGNIMQCASVAAPGISGVAGDVASAFKSLNQTLNSNSLTLAEVSLSAAPAAGLGIISALHTLYVDTIGYAFAAVIIMQTLLEFVRQTAWPIFIPLSLTFLVFPIFRKVGATILSMTIVMYFVYPLTLLLGYEMYLRIESLAEGQEEIHRGTSGLQTELPGMATGLTFGQKEFFREYDPAVNSLLDSPDFQERFSIMFGGENYQPTASTNSQIQVKKLTWYQKAFGMGKDAINYVVGSVPGQAVGAVFDMIGTILKLMFLTIQSYDIYNVFALDIFHKLSIESLYMIYAFMQPVITMVIVITAYRDVSSALGGEVDLFGLAERLGG